MKNFDSKMRPLWSKEECSCCGETGYATRSESKPADKPYVCGECEIANRYAEQTSKVIETLLLWKDCGPGTVIKILMGEKPNER